MNKVITVNYDPSCKQGFKKALASFMESVNKADNEFDLRERKAIDYPYYHSVDPGEPSIFEEGMVLNPNWVDWVLQNTRGLSADSAAANGWETIACLVNEPSGNWGDVDEPHFFSRGGGVSMGWILWFKRIQHKDLYPYNVIIEMAKVMHQYRGQ